MERLLLHLSISIICLDHFNLILYLLMQIKRLIRDPGPQNQSYFKKFIFIYHMNPLMYGLL